jgi:hypothetical protein
MGSINVIKEYQDYYGLGSQGSAATGIVFSIFQVGQMTGALFIWIADLRGRKFGILLDVAASLSVPYSPRSRPPCPASLEHAFFSAFVRLSP